LIIKDRGQLIAKNTIQAVSKPDYLQDLMNKFSKNYNSKDRSNKKSNGGQKKAAC
jgi:hypothetical protein